MLKEDLEKLDIENILDLINKNGAVILPNFLSHETVNLFLSDFESVNKENLNNNNSGIVFYNNQKFISQILVHSKNLFDLLINNKVQSIFKQYLHKYTLSATRFYLTGGGGVSMWHHDEKNSGFNHSSNSRGIIMIIYLNDVLTLNDGPFQYINQTHKLSKKLDEKYFWEENIQLSHKNDIVTCFGKMGTIIIADSRTIHRAVPHKGNYFRKSIFSQISSLDEKTFRERILFNPAFIGEDEIKSNVIMDFLGFGLKNTNHIFPPTDLSHVPLNKSTFKMIIKWLLKAILKNIFESFPLFFKKPLRKKIKREIDYDSQEK